MFRPPKTSPAVCVWGGTRNGLVGNSPHAQLSQPEDRLSFLPKKTELLPPQERDRDPPNHRGEGGIRLTS